MPRKAQPQRAMIESGEIRLEACLPAHVLTLLESPAKFESSFGKRVADGLREMYGGPDVSPEWLASLRASATRDPWRHGFFVVLQEAELVIGSAGYKGRPDGDGMVEIAYGIAPQFRGRGFATQAASALIAWAAQSPQTGLIRAHTLPEKNASTRVLLKCGFSFMGEVIDPDDGPVWRWERRP